MRRFSQRSSLVTLSEINITPLLDLAFVLLIIFVITTPFLEQGLPLKLPSGVGQPDKPVDPRDVRTIDIGGRGIYTLDRRRMTLTQLEAELVRDFQANPNLIVRIREDELGPYKEFVTVLDMCRRHGITRLDVRTEAGK